jgi:glycosyltransferase involved in cell wall biosynthesis
MRAAPINLDINGRFLSQPTTGVQRVAREVTREIDSLLEERGDAFRVRLLCREDADPSGLGLKRIETIRLPGRRSGLLWEQMILPKAVGTNHLLCLGNTAPLRSLRAGRPVTVLIHDLSYRDYPQAYRRSYRLLHSILLPEILNRADPVVTVSETERAILARLAPGTADRIVVAQNGGWREADAVEARKPAAPSSAYGLYVGSLSNRKNVDGVLATATRLAQEDGRRFMVVGANGSFLAPVRTDVAAPVRDLVELRGQVESLADLEAIYRGAAYLLFPSFYEASPLPPLEAMHFGVPVIVSDLPALRERCGDAAEYCDPHDVESIVAAVRRVMNDPVRRADLIARGHARARAVSWRRQAATILNAIAKAS